MMDNGLMTKNNWKYGHLVFPEFVRYKTLKESLPQKKKTLKESLSSMAHIQLQRLSRHLCRDEIQNAVFRMGPFKAPGLYGFQAIFYQHQWVTGKSSINLKLKKFGLVLGSWKVSTKSLITLIPKLIFLKGWSNLRPISICNISFKIITKIIVNQLKEVMPNLTLPNLVSFFSGHQIQDNIIVALEIIPSIRKMKVKKGHMLVKIDLEKAYDRLSWEFI